MRSTLSIVLACLVTSSVYAAPYEKRWTPKSAQDVHIDWPGSGGDKSSSRWPLPRLPKIGHWPFSGRYGSWEAPSPPPTRTLNKKSYLDLEQRAASTGSCDLQNAINYMDLTAVSPALPEPVDLTLFQVALGRGTQNYTCDLANATATPVPIGALATLYNFSCVAAQQPALLRKLPQIALNQPIPSSNNTDPAVINELESGHHYFIDGTIPFFNLDTSMHQYGMGAVAKANASDAPAGAIAGQHGKEGFGAVQWLRLVQTQFAQEDWKAVYRLNTAGGNPPESCTGQQPSFEIQYAAEYWLFT